MPYDPFIHAQTSGEIYSLLVWVSASLLLLVVAIHLKVLSVDGAVGAFVMGVFIFCVGKWMFIIPMALFFLLSSLLSKIGKDRREATGISFRRGSRRDVVQVLANGGVPSIAAVWWFYSPSELLYAAYLASVAAATADTWGTEIGIFSPRPPRHITSLRTVEPGTSGGVTLLGTLGGIAGSTVVAFAGFAYLPDWSVMVSITLAGFGASLVDSLLGGTVQGVYRCAVCRKRTETATHCDDPAVLVRGSRFITNDTVNLLCTLSGGLAALLLV